MRATFVPIGGTPPGTRPWGFAIAGLLLAVIGGAAIAQGASPGRVWILLLLAPVLEEALFRAGLQEALLRIGQAPWAANVLTAIAFGLAHAAMHGSPAAFAVTVPALAIGMVYGRRRRLSPCIALHAAMNAAWIGWSLGQPAFAFSF